MLKGIFFHKISILLTLCATTALNVGCDKYSDPAAPVVKPSIGVPVFFEVYDTECQNSTTETPLYLLEQDINFDTRGEETEYITVKYDPILDATQGLPQFQSYSVMKVTHYNDGEFNEDLMTQRLSSSTGFKICNEKFTYPNHSIESVALKVEHIVSQVNKYHNKIIIHNPVSPINVHIQPDIKVIKDGVEVGSATNNAFFTHSKKDDAPMLAFLPHSKKYYEKYGKDNSLWNMPGVIAHEYGHYIYSHNLAEVLGQGSIDAMYSCFPQKLNDEKESQNSIKINSHHRAHFEIENDLHPTSSALSNGLKKQLIFGSLNEGFADVFAQISLKNTINEDFKISINCADTDRSVYSSRFSDFTTKKVLKTGVLKILLREIEDGDQALRSQAHQYKNATKKESASISLCEKPDFKDIHQVGAIFAYSFFNLIKDSGSLSKEAQFKTLITFLENMKDNLYKKTTSSSSPEDYVKFILNEFISSLEKNQETALNYNQCYTLTDVYEIFPNFEADLKAENPNRCQL